MASLSFYRQATATTTKRPNLRLNWVIRISSRSIASAMIVATDPRVHLILTYCIATFFPLSVRRRPILAAAESPLSLRAGGAGRGGAKTLLLLWVRTLRITALTALSVCAGLFFRMRLVIVFFLCAPPLSACRHAFTRGIVLLLRRLLFRGAFLIWTDGEEVVLRTTSTLTSPETTVLNIILYHSCCHHSRGRRGGVWRRKHDC